MRVYKIRKDSETGKALAFLFAEKKRASESINAIAKDLGFKGFYIRSDGEFAGFSGNGIKPDGYRKVADNCYFPTVKNKAVIEKVKEFPLIAIERFSKALRFEPQFICEGSGLYDVKVPKINETRSGDYAIQICDGVKYDPPADVIEIFGSEYEALIAERES